MSDDPLEPSVAFWRRSGGGTRGLSYDGVVYSSVLRKPLTHVKVLTRIGSMRWHCCLLGSSSRGVYIVWAVPCVLGYNISFAQDFAGTSHAIYL